MQPACALQPSRPGAPDCLFECTPHLGSCLASLLECAPGVSHALLQRCHLFPHLLQLEGVLLQLSHLGLCLHLQDSRLNHVTGLTSVSRQV